MIATIECRLGQAVLRELERRSDYAYSIEPAPATSNHYR